MTEAAAVLVKIKAAAVRKQRHYKLKIFEKFEKKIG